MAKKNTSYASRLKKMQKEYAEAIKRPDSFEKTPEGIYITRLSDAKIHESQKSGNLSVQLSFVIAAGELKGKKITDFNNISNGDGIFYTGRKLRALGVEMPGDFSEIEDVLADLRAEKPCCTLKVVHNGDFVNNYVQKLIDEDEIDDLAEIMDEAADEAEELDDDGVEDEEDGWAEGDYVTVDDGEEEAWNGTIVSVDEDEETASVLSEDDDEEYECSLDHLSEADEVLDDEDEEEDEEEDDEDFDDEEEEDDSEDEDDDEEEDEDEEEEEDDDEVDIASMTVAELRETAVEWGYAEEDEAKKMKKAELLELLSEEDEEDEEEEEDEEDDDGVELEVGLEVAVEGRGVGQITKLNEKTGKVSVELADGKRCTVLAEKIEVL